MGALPTETDVVVVGGGLAGLAAARRLHQAGTPWLLVEAADRLGGRVATDAVDGYLIDRGFQVVNTAYPRQAALVDLASLNLGLLTQGVLVRRGETRHRMVHPLRDPLGAARTILTGLADGAQLGWLGRAPDREPADAGELILRYLRAYGPASSADVRAWSGLTGLPEVLKRIRPQLRIFRDARGRELLDVPDAPLPHPDTPAPPRFLPAFDNAVLGYSDRRRIIDDEHRNLSAAGERVLLVDGRVAATWTSDAEGVTVHPLRRLSAAERADVEREGHALAAFLAEGAPAAVRFAG